VAEKQWQQWHEKMAANVRRRGGDISARATAAASTTRMAASWALAATARGIAHIRRGAS
jgi:hypothetical protein